MEITTVLLKGALRLLNRRRLCHSFGNGGTGQIVR